MNVPRLRRGRPRSKVLSFRRGWCHDDDVELGRVRYARNGDVRIAYRVIGSGDATMVWTPGWISNLDLLDNPMNPFAALLQQLGGVTRIFTFDKRGTGLSDPVTRIPPLDERMDDLHAVMDAAGLDSPVSLFGVSEGGASTRWVSVDQTGTGVTGRLPSRSTTSSGHASSWSTTRRRQTSWSGIHGAARR